MAGFPVNTVDPVTGIVTGTVTILTKALVTPPTQVSSRLEEVYRDAEGVAYIDAKHKFGNGVIAAPWLDEVADTAITTLIEPEE